MYYGRKNLGKKRRCRPRMRTVLEEPVSWRNAASRPGLDELRNSMRISERLTEWEPHGETRVDPRDHLSDGCEDGNGRPLAARRPDDVLERAYCLLVHVFELRPDVPRHGRAYDVDVIRVRRDRRPECEIELEVLRSVRPSGITPTRLSTLLTDWKLRIADNSLPLALFISSTRCVPFATMNHPSNVASFQTLFGY